jgi:hypothetical protein
MYDPFDPFASHGSQVSSNPSDEAAIEAAVEGYLASQPQPEVDCLQSLGDPMDWEWGAYDSGDPNDPFSSAFVPRVPR